MNSLQSGHSRRSSDTSQISINSGCSFQVIVTVASKKNFSLIGASLVQERDVDGVTVTGNGPSTASSGSSSSSSAGHPGMAGAGEEDLWSLWGKLINEWDSAANRRRMPQIKELARRGIPHHFRGIAWQLLCDAHESKDKQKYAEHMKTQSACEKVIRRDIARTYPEHEFFAKKDGVGQEALFNVMKAYSVHDREVGYCQGSAFIVGLLLMQMPEEESFCVLVKLMQEYRMREMFKPSMAELGLCMYQLEMLVQEHVPDLFAHFQSQSIHTNLYASSWFLTLFTTALPIGLACRIMDCFLCDGLEVIFRLALALLTTAKQELLVQDMEGVIRVRSSHPWRHIHPFFFPLQYFQKEMPSRFEADPDAIFALAYAMKINQKKMKKLEKEYTTMKTREKEDEIELRVRRSALTSYAYTLKRGKVETFADVSSSASLAVAVSFSPIRLSCSVYAPRIACCARGWTSWSRSRATWRIGSSRARSRAPKSRRIPLPSSENWPPSSSTTW